MSNEQVCQRCRRVCFSQEQFETHECFDATAKLDAEIALVTVPAVPVNVPFLKWMDEYREKQTGCYGSGEPTADDGVGEEPTKAVNHEDGTGAVANRKPSDLTTNGGAAQSFSAPLVTAGPGMEALILAKTRLLLSRSLAYMELADLQCARKLAVEVRDHISAIEAYSFAKGITWEVAKAMVELAGLAQA